jgi:hypothetical protein
MRLSDTSSQWKVSGMDLHGKEGATYLSLFDAVSGSCHFEVKSLSLSLSLPSV